MQGSRSVRRAMITIAAMACACAAACGNSASDPDDRGTGRTASDVLYAIGPTIHDGDRTIEADAPIRYLGRTSEGILYATENHVMFTDGHEPVQLGNAIVEGFIVDDSGPYVAWVESADAIDGDYVVVDTSRIGTPEQDVLREPAATEPLPRGEGIGGYGPIIEALDDGVVYWHDNAGITAYDVADGTRTTLAGVMPYAIRDVAAGQIAYTGDTKAGSAFTVGTTLGTGAGLELDSPAILSPDGSLIAGSSMDGSARVLEVATGRDLTPEFGEYDYVAAYGWLDGRTLGAVGTPDFDEADEAGRLVLLTCDLDSGSCRDVVEINWDASWQDKGWRFVLPNTDLF